MKTLVIDQPIRQAIEDIVSHIAFMNQIDGTRVVNIDISKDVGIVQFVGGREIKEAANIGAGSAASLGLAGTLAATGAGAPLALLVAAPALITLMSDPTVDEIIDQLVDAELNKERNSALMPADKPKYVKVIKDMLTTGASQIVENYKAQQAQQATNAAGTGAQAAQNIAQTTTAPVQPQQPVKASKQFDGRIKTSGIFSWLGETATNIGRGIGDLFSSPDSQTLIDRLVELAVQKKMIPPGAKDEFARVIKESVSQGFKAFKTETTKPQITPEQQKKDAEMAAQGLVPAIWTNTQGQKVRVYVKTPPALQDGKMWIWDPTSNQNVQADPNTVVDANTNQPFQTSGAGKQQGGAPQGGGQQGVGVTPNNTFSAQDIEGTGATQKDVNQATNAMQGLEYAPTVSGGQYVPKLSSSQSGHDKYAGDDDDKNSAPGEVDQLIDGLADINPGASEAVGLIAEATADINIDGITKIAVITEELGEFIKTASMFDTIVSQLEKKVTDPKVSKKIDFISSMLGAGKPFIEALVKASGGKAEENKLMKGYTNIDTIMDGARKTLEAMNEYYTKQKDSGEPSKEKETPAAKEVMQIAGPEVSLKEAPEKKTAPEKRTVEERQKTKLKTQAPAAKPVARPAVKSVIPPAPVSSDEGETMTDKEMEELLGSGEREASYLRLNSGTFSIHRGGAYYNELESLMKKVASDDAISEINEIEIELTREGCEASFRIKQADFDFIQAGATALLGRFVGGDESMITTGAKALGAGFTNWGFTLGSTVAKFLGFNGLIGQMAGGLLGSLAWKLFAGKDTPKGQQAMSEVNSNMDPQVKDMVDKMQAQYPNTPKEKITEHVLEMFGKLSGASGGGGGGGIAGMLGGALKA